MNNPLEGPDPLRGAIAEFAGAVDRLIDEQIARLNALGIVELIPAAVEPVGRSRRLAAATENEESARSTPPRPIPAPAPSDATARAGDHPGQRLDALARHLDERLRRERKGPKPPSNQ